jgi:hypothetical protein
VSGRVSNRPPLKFKAEMLLRELMRPVPGVVKTVKCKNRRCVGHVAVRETEECLNPAGLRWKNLSVNVLLEDRK